MWLEWWLSGAAVGGLAGLRCSFVDVVGPECGPACVVPEPGLDVVGELGGVACGALFGIGDGEAVACGVDGNAADSSVSRVGGRLGAGLGGGVLRAGCRVESFLRALS